jgi:enoyl-CoA hydratase
MSQVELKIEDGIAVLSVIRPEALNALNRDIVDEIDKLVDKIAGDDTVRCLLIHNDKNFAAGADIKAPALLPWVGLSATLSPYLLK